MRPSTTEYDDDDDDDDDGTIHRTLSAAMRAAVLAGDRARRYVTPSTSTRRRPMGPTSPTSTDRSTWCNSLTGPPAPTGSTIHNFYGTGTQAHTSSPRRYRLVVTSSERSSERPAGSALSAGAAAGSCACTGRFGYEPSAGAAASNGRIYRLVMTSSTAPYSTACSAVRMKSRSVSLDTRSSGCPVWGR